MKPEKLQLIDELMGDEARHESTLVAATGIMRRRRQWRAVRQTAALVTLLAVALFVMNERNLRQITAQLFTVKSRHSCPTGYRILDSL